MSALVENFPVQVGPKVCPCGFSQPIHKKQNRKQRSAISSADRGTQSTQAKYHRMT